MERLYSFVGEGWEREDDNHPPYPGTHPLIIELNFQAETPFPRNTVN
jgi:hypothetical protein